MSYLLDTCVISDFFKKQPSVLKRFKEASPEELHLSALTIMEIEFGLKLHAEREKKIRPLWEELLTWITTLPYSKECAVATASIRADLKHRGLPVGAYDLLIGGTALAHNLIMVTSNRDEFDRMPGLTVEDWRD